MGTRDQARRGHLVRERAVEEGVGSTWKVTLRGAVTLPEVAGAVITPFPLSSLPFPGHSFGLTEGKKSKQVSDSWQSVSWVREQVQKNDGPWGTKVGILQHWPLPFVEDLPQASSWELSREWNIGLSKQFGFFHKMLANPIDSRNS